MPRKGSSAQKQQDSLIALSSARARKPGGGGGVVSVTATAPVVSSGGITPNITFSGVWPQGFIAPTLTQARQAPGSPPQPFTVAPQAPDPAATNATNGTSGPFVVSLAPPVNGGAEGFLGIERTSGGNPLILGPLAALPAANALWSVGPPSVTNYSFLIGPTVGIFNLNAATVASSAAFQFLADGVTGFVFIGKTVNGQGINLTSNQNQFGDGVGIVGITEAATEPTLSVTVKTLVWSFANGALKTRSKNGFKTNLAAVGQGAIASQTVLVDTDSGVVSTVASAAPTPIETYTTISGTAGLLTLYLVSRATSAGGGIAVGDATMSTYVLGYKNVAGAVTLSTAGITLVGAAQTTNAALTSVLTATAVGATVVIDVTNVAAVNVDSQVDLRADVC